MSLTNKIKETFYQEGFIGLMKKINRGVFTLLCQWSDKFFTKLLSRIYTKGFHKLFYYTFMRGKDKNINWLGIPTSKLPLDMWIYQEMIYEIKPDLIIETGTDRGGSALFFASIFDLIGQGYVITIDINNYSEKVNHPRIIKIIGDSISAEVVKKVKEIIGNKIAMVVLDSDHRKNHVLKEMELYSEFVPINSYMIVEDTNLNGYPVMPGWGAGPMEAVKGFLKKRNDFAIDRSLEKFKITFYPNGFLKRIK